MEDRKEILIKSYELFRWALSHCGRFPINEKIQKKVRILNEIFGLDYEDLLQDIFAHYLEKEDYKRFDPRKGRLSTFIHIYTNRWLYHTIRKHERINKKCQTEQLPEDYEDALDDDHRAEHSLRLYEKMGRQDDLFESTTPENFYEANELWELIVDIVGLNDALVLIGVKDRKVEAAEQGLDYYTYCQRLYRKKRSLRKVLLALDYPI